MSGVASWPKYLLRDIPDEIRAAVEEDAEREQCAMIEVVREILCGHYSLDCDPVEATAKPPAPVKGTGTMVLRLQPALMDAIQADSGNGYGDKRRTILGILAAHYA